MNFSLHDIRQFARKTQNTLIKESPFQTKLRETTTTDPWLPSPADLASLNDCSIVSTVDIRDQVSLIFERIDSYSSKTLKRRTFSEDLYNRAVHYVNSGNEWRIVLKCVKVLEYFILNNEASFEPIRNHSFQLEHLRDKYNELSADDSQTTSGALERQKNQKTVHSAIEEVLRLLKDDGYRGQKMDTLAKIENTSIKGNFTQSDKRKDHAPRGFHEKSLDRHKIEHSNLKSQVKNHISHSFKRKEKLPGEYKSFAIQGGLGNTQDSYDSGDDNYGYGYHHHHQHDSFSASEENESNGDADVGDHSDDDDDDFGKYQGVNSTDLLAQPNKSVVDLVSL